MDANEIQNLVYDIDFDLDVPTFELGFQESSTNDSGENQVCSESNEDDEVTAYIDSNKNLNTKKKTISDLNCFRRWCESRQEKRDLLDIPPEELDQLMALFFIKIRKLDGSAYEPGTLTGFQRSIDRHLRENWKTYSPLTDKIFEKSRNALAARRKELRKEGKGRKPNKALGLTENEVEKLWSRGLLGSDDPLSLLRTMWFNNTMQFGWRARDEHRKLRNGDLNQARKPEDMKSDDSPFYLAYIPKPKSYIWYKSSPLGVNSLGNFMKSMATEAELKGKRTNHSTRRTMITTLRHENVNPLDISQLSGHKNLKSIDSYSEVSEEQQQRMSLSISRRAEGANSALQPLQQANTTNTSYSHSTGTSTTSAASMLSGAVFNNCSIVFNWPSEAQLFGTKPQHSSADSIPEKRQKRLELGD